MYLLLLFIVQKFLEQIQNYEDAAQNDRFAAKKNSEKLLMYLLDTFIMQNFEKVLGVDPEL